MSVPAATVTGPLAGEQAGIRYRTAVGRVHALPQEPDLAEEVEASAAQCSDPPPAAVALLQEAGAQSLPEQ